MSNIPYKPSSNFHHNAKLARRLHQHKQLHIKNLHWVTTRTFGWSKSTIHYAKKKKKHSQYKLSITSSDSFRFTLYGSTHRQYLAYMQAWWINSAIHLRILWHLLWQSYKAAHKTFDLDSSKHQKLQEENKTSSKYSKSNTEVIFWVTCRRTAGIVSLG